MDAEQAAEASTPTPPPAAADKAAAVICECNGVIRLQHVREQLEAIAENPAGDSLRDVAETQRFVEHLANFVNTIVPIHATAATLRNLHDAALWLTKIINTISRKKMGI